MDDAGRLVEGQSGLIPWSASLRVLAARFLDVPAVTDQHGQELSYRALSERAHSLAWQLTRRCINAGTPVAVLLPNCVEAVWVAYGIRLAGAAEAPLGWGYTPEEIVRSAQLADFKLVVTCDARAAQIRALGFEVLIASLVEPLHVSDDKPFAPVPADAPARIAFTSGTTGRPKGFTYSHGRRWIGEQLLKASLPFTPTPGAQILLVTPFPHGASLLVHAWCDYGGHVLLMDGVDPDRIAPLLRSRGIDALFAPPTVIAKLAGAFKDERFEGMRCVFTGTQPLGATLYRKACAMFGPVVRITYGMTECVNPITVLDPLNTHEYFSEVPVPPGSCVGWPAPGVEIELRGEEVWLRACHMSDGLIGADGPIPREPNGWRATGDLGHFDRRGRLVLTGRAADVIKTGGYRVHPAEIEAHLADMASCGPVCVAALPSEYWGEVIIAVAEQPTAGWELEAQARVSVLSRHQRPRLHVSVPALPRNAQGKVSRRELVTLLLATYTLIDGPNPELSLRANPSPV